MSSPGEPLDLIDLKFLPAWVKEDWSAARHAGIEEEEQAHWPREGMERRPRPPHQRRGDEKNRRRRDRGERDDRKPLDRKDRKRSRDFPARREAPATTPLPQLDVHFLPQAAAFENVAAQIKTGTAAYSVYALARLFLQKPERYHVRVKMKNASPLFRLGESNAISTNRSVLENSAFRLLREKFYTVNVTLNDPIKGDFSSVARERTTGTLLGPTNHHGYQPQLRRLYEQRFSRRLSFTDFQRQIEIVSDPALVEQWKEEARKVTTFTTQQEEPPQTFNAETEAERHFREKYLPSLISESGEAEIDGVTSRKLQDRGTARLIENAWSAEVRSPSNMMQELAGRFRGAGLRIFRHRKGMLFVSPIRLKAVDETAVSDSVRQILEALKASPRINRKELAEKLIGLDTELAEAEKTKLALASDLHWMIREGHVIEFNDGSLDLPRARPPKKEAGEVTADLPPATAAATTEATATTSGATTEESDVAAAVAGGSADNLSVIPSREDIASPARTEVSQEDSSDETSKELSPVIPSREDGEGPHERPNAPDQM
ncbi:MAG: hypothetical protein DMF19_05500 [Verrucomicrobia bacterium]|nr:MAG: hypothetical protein DMF19_05500 [Verrucomicrobiota bacterium]